MKNYIIEIECKNCNTKNQVYLYANQKKLCSLCKNVLAKNAGGKVKIEQ